MQVQRASENLELACAKNFQAGVAATDTDDRNAVGSTLTVSNCAFRVIHIVGARFITTAPLVLFSVAMVGGSRSTVDS